MARIRTIKPEFPQSESMGKVSRDARLLFVLLWPVCDDHGRTRAASRMLASTLYPYDDGEDGHARTTGADVARWLDELEREGCIRRYEVDGAQYLEVCNWLKHQKIDKPSRPQIPEPSASPREPSRESIEPSPLEGNGREWKGEEKDRELPPATPPATPPASSPSAGPKQKKATAKSPLPADFAVSERVQRWAAEKGYDRLDEHLDAFRRKAGMNGYRYVDWDSALMEAIREDWAKLRGGVRGAAPAPTSIAPRRREL